MTAHEITNILGEVDDTFNLFYMFKDGKKIVLKSYKSFMGWDTNVILEEVMNTASVNQLVVLLENCTAC